MKIIKFIDKLLNFIVTIFFIIIIAFSGYALYDINTVYNDAKLSDDILRYRPSDYQEGEVEKFNLSDLQNNINEDICGWLRIDGTNIDYPILFPKTSLEYLDKDYNKNYSPAGSIFIDYQNDRLFSDDYTLIYGHNMAKKMMFSDIKEFQDVEYFKNHSTGKLYTGDVIYNIKIYSYNVLDSNVDIAYKIMQYKNGKNKNLIESFKKSAINRRDYDINEDSKLVVLSTCNGAGTSQRATLFCVLEKSTDTSEIINEENNSNIEKDKKRIEAEKREESKKNTSIKNKDEISKDGKKYKAYNAKWDRTWYYIKRNLKDPRKLSLYILIILTIIIYIVLIVKRLKRKKKKDKPKDKSKELNKTREKIAKPKKENIINNKNINKSVERAEKINYKSSRSVSRDKGRAKSGKGKHSM